MFGYQLPVVYALGTSVAYFIALLVLLYRRGFSNWLPGLFVLYLVTSICWSVGHALMVWQGLIHQMPQLGWEIAYSTIILMPAIVVVMTVLFFELRRARSVAIVGTILVACVALIDNNAFGLQTILQRQFAMHPIELLQNVRWVVWGSLSLGAVVLSIWNYAITWRPMHRNRILYWLISLLLIIAGEGITLMFGAWAGQPGLIVRLMGVWLLTFTLVSYYHPSLYNIFRRSLAAALVTLVTGGLYLLGLLLVQPALSMLKETALLIALGTIAFVMAVVTPTVRRWVQSLLDRLLFGGRYDPSRALREYSTAISNILDLQTLVTISVGIISEAMETRRGAFLLLKEHEDGIVDVEIIPGMGEIKVTSAQFSANSPVLNHLRTSAQPLTHYEIDMLPQFRSAPWNERAWLQNLDMELYVPIRQYSLLIAVLVLGERAGGMPYSTQDFNVLSTLADQTTVGLQNARLVADLKALNTQMNQLNEELKGINRHLEKLDAAKSDFIQIASHEFRTPLTQVRGYADMMADIVQSGISTPSQLIQISQGISRATQRLEEIIKAMLDVSQIDVQALNLTRTPLAMTTVIRMALEPYRDGLKQRNQTLVIEGIEGLLPVSGDLQRVCQALGNIIVNCIKYTPDGGQITISGRASQTLDIASVKAPCVELVIADTGIGIDPDDHELIFEKFYRVGSLSLHSTGTTKFMGAGPGLGLPIAKGVIEAHGGKVWVESEGRDEQRCPGSRFHVVLPAASVDQVA